MTDEGRGQESERDAHFMGMALELARKADWRTHPNPMVGAVIVAGDRILGRGFHRAAGLDHAEVAALKDAAGSDLRGAEMFVTLEPCNHFARTPPCTEALIEAGISRVVVATVDPDPRVSGSGIERLRAAGIAVTVGVLEQECAALNGPFFKRVSGRPWVTAKVAMSLDGKIATVSGESQWITGPEARQDVHRLRRRHDAIMVGTGTLLADNPQLTCRLDEFDGPQPLRVVLDRQLKASDDRKVWDTNVAPTLLVTSHENVDEATQRLAHRGVEVLGVDVVNKHLMLSELLTALAAKQVTTLLCEGGGELVASLFSGGNVDEYIAYVGPIVIGGMGAPGPVTGPGTPALSQAHKLRVTDVTSLGQDLRITASIPGDES